MSHTAVVEFNCQEGVGETFLAGLLPAPVSYTHLTLPTICSV